MRKLMIPVLVVGLVLLLMSLFVIPEGERGIVIRFGRVLKDNNEIALLSPLQWSLLHYLRYLAEYRYFEDPKQFA